MSVLDPPRLTTRRPRNHQRSASRVRRAAADLATASAAGGVDALLARHRLLAARLQRPSAPRARPAVAVGPDSPGRIERALLLGEPIERVWALLTNPTHVGAWLGQDGTASIDLRPGGRIEVRTHSGTGLSGLIEHVEAPHRLSYRRSHPAPGISTTTVEVTLEPHGAGCRLRLVEHGTPASAPPGIEPADRAGTWTSALQRLGEYTTMTEEEILQAAAALPVATWTYRRRRTVHLGPMAQDWAAAFRLTGARDKVIPVVDYAGTLLACVHALYGRYQETAARMDELEAQIGQLREHPAALDLSEWVRQRDAVATASQAGSPR